MKTTTAFAFLIVASTAYAWAQSADPSDPPVAVAGADGSCTFQKYLPGGGREPIKLSNGEKYERGVSTPRGRAKIQVGGQQTFLCKDGKLHKVDN